MPDLSTVRPPIRSPGSTTRAKRGLFFDHGARERRREGEGGHAAALRLRSTSEKPKPVGSVAGAGRGLVPFGLGAQEVLARNDLVGDERLSTLEIAFCNSQLSLGLDPCRVGLAHGNTVQRGKGLPHGNPVTELRRHRDDPALNARRHTHNPLLVGLDRGCHHNGFAHGLCLDLLNLDTSLLGFFGGQGQLLLAFLVFAFLLFLLASVIGMFGTFTGMFILLPAFAARSQRKHHRQGHSQRGQSRWAPDGIIERLHRADPSCDQPAAFSSSIRVV